MSLPALPAYEVLMPAFENLPSPPVSSGWRWEHTYAELPRLLHERWQLDPVPKPGLILFNRALAASFGLDAKALDSASGAAIFSGNELPSGAQPLAQAYAGHQFGNFTVLGDGRALLLGEHITPSGQRVDIQLKGSGRTPFSRGGDGRAALGPMLREYIISEAMHALGIPTTRSLAVATTGASVYRGERLPGAVLTRVAASHIRVGTFEYVAARGDKTALQQLADYTIRRHYPEIAGSDEPYSAFFRAVMERQAALIAQWQQVGFIHGVMNTDNMALSGETIDFGPCAFMDSYDPATVFSSIDHQGRYAYRNQPLIAQWNLARLAETLLPLFHAEEEKAIALANEAIETFSPIYQRYWLKGMRAKLGLFNEEQEDTTLIQNLLEWMRKNQADFTNTFRHLSLGTDPAVMAEPDPEFTSWHQNWLERRGRQPQSLEDSTNLMRRHNPAFIPRNHKVEEALEAASTRQDPSVLQNLLSVLAAPYDYDQDLPEYRLPAAPGACAYQTFCGT
jgi:serine/tyrosine/threonine adenylyltransferase